MSYLLLQLFYAIAFVISFNTQQMEKKKKEIPANPADALRIIFEGRNLPYVPKPKCPNCGTPHCLTDYDCDMCGWEFGFEGGGIDEKDFITDSRDESTRPDPATL